MSALSFSVKGDINKMSKSLNFLQKKLVPLATVTALNKTGTKTKTQIVKQVSTRTKIKSKLIRRRVKIYKANKHTKSIVVFFGTYNISYASFLTKSGNVIETKKGIRIGKFNFPGAFKTTMPNGHTDYYQRKGKNRLPIKKASVGIYQEAQTAMNYSQKVFAPKIFKKEFDYELKRRLSNAGY